MRQVLLLLIFFISTIQTNAKYATVIHYDQENGLSASYGYGIFQDSHGYVYISTENGLARFNGYDFRMFTVKDGLPDNEVFSLNEDSKGRIWFAPFTNNIGYIKNNKVYSRLNDTLLKKLKFNNRPETILFDQDGNTFFCERTTITCLSTKNTIKQFTLSAETETQVKVFISNKGKFNVIIKGKIYEYHNSSLRQTELLPAFVQADNAHFYYSTIGELGSARALRFLEKLSTLANPIFTHGNAASKFNAVDEIRPGLLAICRKDGCFLVDIASSQVIDTLLFGKNVGYVTTSRDGSLWLGTHGSGVFRFIHSPIQTLQLPAIPSSVDYIHGLKNGVYATLEKDKYIKAQFTREDILAVQEQTSINTHEGDGHIIYLGQNSNQQWITCKSDITLSNAITQRPIATFYSTACKDVFGEDAKHLLVANANRLFRLNKETLKETATLFVKRTTSVTKIGTTIYVGTLDGLWYAQQHKTFEKVFAGQPELNGHIVKLAAGTDGTIWVANSNSNLLAIKSNKLVALITDEQGLQCNRISAIKATPGFIWVGTDNGLFVLKNESPYPIVRHLSFFSGLNSNQVNCLDISEGRVWVGTSKGINYFDEHAIFEPLPALKLNIANISSGHNTIDYSEQEMILSADALSIDFDVVDLSGGQKPLFQYQLNTDTNWTTLKTNNLFFPDLPYGKYVVHIRARSPNWTDPANRTLLFYVPYPFYLRGWFITLSSVLLLCAIASGGITYIRKVRQKDEKRLLTERNLLQLEQLSLQGQMNPHFIFNCITAIKQHYNSGNMESANAFVDIFTALMRQTFEMVAETFVPLDKELNYLHQYLMVEQARFDHSFDFSITRRVSLPETSIPVPALMLQPLVENAIRHGIRHLSHSDRRGMISIEVIQEGNSVHIVLQDNGVGRARSKQFSRFLHQVKMTSTMVNAKRVDILNRLFNNQILHHTGDILDANGHVAGTRVTVSYPVTIQEARSK